MRARARKHIRPSRYARIDLDELPSGARDGVFRAVVHASSTQHSLGGPQPERLERVFVGPAGTVTRLHYDYGGTHAWLAQIRGR